MGRVVGAAGMAVTVDFEARMFILLALFRLRSLLLIFIAVVVGKYYAFQSCWCQSVTKRSIEMCCGHRRWARRQRGCNQACPARYRCSGDRAGKISAFPHW